MIVELTAHASRDKIITLTGIAGRLQRAYNNHFESLVIITIAVVLINLSNQSTPLTQNCAWAYVVARALYILVEGENLTIRNLCDCHTLSIPVPYTFHTAISAQSRKVNTHV